MKIPFQLGAAGLAAAACLSLSTSASAQANALFQAHSIAPALQTSPLAASALVPQTGQLVITEIMKDPSSVADTQGEWFEVHNRMPWRVNVENWVISDDSGAQHVINNGGNRVLIFSGKYFVFGNNNDSATNGGVTVHYKYTGFVLGNGADQIQLTRPNGNICDRVDYDDGVAFPDSGGRSMGLNPDTVDALLNDDGTNWCNSLSNLGPTNSDTGTPGRANDVCP